MKRQHIAKFLKDAPTTRKTRQIYHLNLLSNFPGSALKLDSEKIDKIQLYMRNKTFRGAPGLHKFWKNNLRTIFFYNPSIPMEVTRISATEEEASKVPAIIRLLYKNGTSKDIDCKEKTSEEILESFVRETKAVEIAEEERVIISSN